MSSAAQTQPVQVEVCAVEDIPVGLGRAFVVGGRSIAVFRTRKGEVRAVENACPHRGAPLADGMIAGDSVVCPFHAFRFNLHNGQCDQDSVCGIESFPARVENGRVWVTASQG